jgi:outer membrane protein OmpA-like peptidoglycan-associated protein
MLRGAMPPRRVHLTLVDSLTIAAPCHERWDAMDGTARVRRCASCERSVWDVASLRAAEVVGLAALHGGSLCLRLTHRPDGTVVTRDRRHAPPRAAALFVASALALLPTEAVAQDAGAGAPAVAQPVTASDRDRDGTPDATDHCPDQPGALNADPSRNGCPNVGAVVMGGQIRIRDAIFFQARGAAPLASSTHVLEAVAEALRATPLIRRVRLAGHTSARTDGPRAGLGRRRAEAVRDWLVAHGVDAARLVVEDRAATQPMLPETRATDAARNRRVAFEVIEPASP